DCTLGAKGRPYFYFCRSFEPWIPRYSSSLAPAGTTAPPICKSRHCNGPCTPLRISTTRFFDRSTRTSMKLWKKGARLKSKMPEKVSTLNGHALNHFIQYQNGCFHSGISASIFARRLSVLG